MKKLNIKKLHSHFKSLSFALLCITATAQSMEPGDNNQLAPITFAQTYYRFSEFLHPDVVPLIFSFHLDLNGIDYEGLPALIKDSCKGPKSFVKSVKKLLKPYKYNLATEIFERGLHHLKVSICDIKARNNRTVLHEASFAGHLEVVKIILHITGDKTLELLPIRAKYGNTPLHYAAMYNYIEIAELLLKAAGSNAWKLLTIKDIDSWTVLHVAAYNDYTKFITLLLDAAGDKAQELIDMDMQSIIDMQSIERNTAFDHALSTAQEVMQKYLKDNQ